MSTATDQGSGGRHFLTIEDLGYQQMLSILDTAQSLIGVVDRRVKKLPVLRGKTVATLFFEPSTRTRTSFELAAKRLSADVLNLPMSISATAKGESLLDTLRNLEAMHIDMFVVRHPQSGAAHFMARHAAPHIGIINAGDGRHAHPTQAMLDVFTIRYHKRNFNTLVVAIVGDILHSRVARSLIHALNIMLTGEIRVIAPQTLLPKDIESLGVRVFYSLQGLKDVDVVIMLRLQKERMQTGRLPSEHEYYHQYGLTSDPMRLAKPDAMIMHPGPINRGVEMSSTVADGPQSVILEQVNHGIAIRMAIMSILLGGQPGDQHKP